MADEPEPEPDQNPFSGFVWIPRVPWIGGIPLLYGWRKLVVTREVVVNRDGVFIDGRHLVRRARVQSASLTKDEKGFWFAHVWLRGMRGVVTLGVKDEADGLELMRALTIDARSITANFVFTEPGAVPRLIAVFAGVVLAFIAAFVLRAQHMKGAGMLVMWASLLAMMVLVWTQTVKVAVGADGLMIRKRFGRRFIPHDRIVEAKRDGVDLVVKLDDGELRWPLTMRRNAAGKELEVGTRQGDLIAKRINEARTAYEELGGDASSLPALARAGKSTGDWLDALRRIGEEVDAGFRGGVVGRERLWMLVESTQVPAPFRVRAAIALRISTDGDARKETSARLCEIAEACATPNLGKRLRVAASANEDELAKLLEEDELTGDRDAPRMRRSDP